MSMMRTKPIGQRVPVAQKTTIPDVTHERIGYQISNTSHHFHKPSKKKKKKMNIWPIQNCMDFGMLLVGENEQLLNRALVYTLILIIRNWI